MHVASKPFVRFVPSISLLLLAFSLIAHHFFTTCFASVVLCVCVCPLIAPESPLSQSASRPNKVQASGDAAEEGGGLHTHTHTHVSDFFRSPCPQAFMEAEERECKVQRSRRRSRARKLGVCVYDDGGGFSFT